MATPAPSARQSAEPAWRPEQLPAFPAIALKALNLIAGRDTSLLELCELIRPDPAFSTAILKIANSPLVAFSRDITSVMQAAMLLGFRRLKCVVIAVGLKAYLKGPFTPLLQSCWEHSVACAMIAERAAAGESGFDKDFAYTAGILHDIGRAAMLTASPQPYAQLVATQVDEPRDLLPRERELFGVDHCEAGASLVRAWDLSTAFLEITANHHDPARRSFGTASVIAPSCALADALGFALEKYQVAPSYSDLLDAFSVAARNRFPPEAEALTAEIANEIRVMQTV